MWGLPDSAIYGTVKRLTKKPRRISSSKRKEKVLAQSWSSFEQDFRSFEELLEEAKRHAKEKEKAGK
jgi:hypothetical protein